MNRTLVRHVDALTLEGGVGLRRDCCIAIEGRLIVAVGEEPAAFAPCQVLDGRGKLAVPAFFNAHCHAAMTLERGWAEDLPFPRWLDEKIWVAESALQEEDVYWGAALAACEMMRAGIAGFADHYFWMDQVGRAVEESGMKALLAWCVFGLGREREVGGVDLETTANFVRRWHGAAGGRVRTAFGPHSPYMCPPDFLRQVRARASALGAGIHLHVAESAEQVRTSLERHGLSPVAHLAALGVLDEAGPGAATLAAHCIAVDATDVALLADKGVSVAYTPKTYLKLAMEQTPVVRLLEAGVRVALGTDGPASNADLDLLEVMRLAALMQKQAERDAAALPIERVLALATRCGAEALGFSDSGRLAAGAAADIALFDIRAPHFFPRHDLAAGIVYASHPADVSHLFVDGRLVLRDGEILTLDEERIRFEAERRALRMVGAPMAQVRSYGC